MGLLDNVGTDDDRKDLSETAGFQKGDSINAIAKRVIDEEAGVVIYAAADQSGMDAGGYGLAALPIEDTDLTLNNEPE